MIAGGNVDGKLSGKKMEGDEDLRTVECLRGRLVAERAASRVAKEDAEQMENKLTELENKMRAEIKSRNRAEKRLKLLMKKLDSLNLSSYYHTVSENSSILEKSEMSSVSSSSSTNCQILQQSKTKSPQKNSQDLEYYASRTRAPNSSHCGSNEESLVSEEKPNFEEPSGGEVNSSQDYRNPKTDDLGSSSTSDQAQDDDVDNSLALVPVDLPKESRPPDPLIVNASVADVLDSLRNAREKLQLSMERRRMIEVGSK
ncbi:uncharacterized protein LOC131325960 [Rhododendron vialii]|uniref:uncharacterized protein LOC131325960 n=1 Tax=Rhododendron vialii TaxID=182163 RepID=UPI00265EDCC7|nr:uncharacterized protein LOC131325960 [Rhododendron vialii]